jgi:hypothetical protein
MSLNITSEDRQNLAKTSKLGLLATISPMGEPHISLISSMQTLEEQLIWGEFVHGLSKINLKTNPKCGFLVINAEKQWWKGKALHKEVRETGPEYEMFNNQPLFRYNSYFGIGKVHYMDIMEFSGKQSLPLGEIVTGWLSGLAVKGLAKGCPDGIDKIGGLSVSLAKNPMAPKFLSYVGEDGYPEMIPVVQSVLKDKGRLLIPHTAYKSALEKIKAGTKAAMFLVDLDLTSVLFQGVYAGKEKKMGVTYGIFDIEKVYNSMVPVPGYIYPMREYQIVH